MGLKRFLRKLIDRSPFRPVHIGFYTRNLYFKKYMRKLPVADVVDVLDAGCSDGSYALEISRTFPGFKITAVDLYDNDFPDPAALKDSNITFKQMNLMELNDTGAYDFIYCIDVLEHIEGNRAVIRNLERALKPGGYIYIHIPNDKEYKRILPGRFFREFDKVIDEEHIGEMYTPDQLSRVLQDLGFDVLYSRRTFGLPGKLAWEIDRACNTRFKLRVSLMPILKLLVRLDIMTGHRKGCTLVIAGKSP